MRLASASPAAAAGQRSEQRFSVQALSGLEAGFRRNTSAYRRDGVLSGQYRPSMEKSRHAYQLQHGGSFRPHLDTR